MNNRTFRLAMPWLLLALVGLASAALRYGFIEPRELVDACSASNPPGWCALRQALVLGFLTNGYGYAALLATAIALWLRKPLPSWLAAALGFVALQLFCYQAGALALLLGSLLLLRSQADRLAAGAQPVG